MNNYLCYLLKIIVNFFEKEIQSLEEINNLIIKPIEKFESIG